MEYYDCEQEQWVPGAPPKAPLTAQQYIANVIGGGGTPLINVLEKLLIKHYSSANVGECDNDICTK
ncbi:hypothetical protein TSUD_103460 [Trifolium subterraneum]|uniref:Uncharacterized protein n=1 Tax=Trifolium subterraneum TaxID=3900 RepID=A0A2Z6MYQ2_TRISU|nr:hypothetical protein TSUD_103460 [Trifolium subterraneum]